MQKIIADFQKLQGIIFEEFKESLLAVQILTSETKAMCSTQDGIYTTEESALSIKPGRNVFVRFVYDAGNGKCVVSEILDYARYYKYTETAVTYGVHLVLPMFAKSENLRLASLRGTDFPKQFQQRQPLQKNLDALFGDKQRFYAVLTRNFCYFRDYPKPDQCTFLKKRNPDWFRDLSRLVFVKTGCVMLAFYFTCLENGFLVVHDGKKIRKIDCNLMRVNLLTSSDYKEVLDLIQQGIGNESTIVRSAQRQRTLFLEGQRRKALLEKVY